MAKNLDEILSEIAPERIIDPSMRLVDEAFNSFSFPSAPITDFEKFRQILVDLAYQIKCKLFGAKLPYDENTENPYHYWKDCMEALNQYGAQGHYVAFEMAKAGTNGGIYEILKNVAHSIGMQHIQKNIEIRISQYWQDNSADVWEQSVHEYIKRYPQLFPSEVERTRALASFHKTLHQHPWAMQKFRQLGKQI